MKKTYISPVNEQIDICLSDALLISRYGLQISDTEYNPDSFTQQSRTDADSYSVNFN